MDSTGISRMEEELENVVEKEMNLLNDTVSMLLSSFANNTTSSEIAKAADYQIRSFSSDAQNEILLKEAIRDLLELEAAETQTLNESKTEILGSGVTQQITQLSQANGKKAGLEEEIAALKNRISHKEQLERQLEQKRTSIAKQSLTAIPQANARSQMYSQCSRLKWDYTVPENVVKGFVIQPQKRDVTHFKIDKDSHSQYFITNFLWELIGTDSDF